MTDPNQAVPAEDRPVSLSQAILAPLDAIFKAQVHAARSFLNLLLQIGYPHQPVDENGDPIDASPQDKTPYELEFQYDVSADGKTEHHSVKVPALALVPIAPIAVDTASFQFALRIVKNSFFLGLGADLFLHRGLLLQWIDRHQGLPGVNMVS